MEVDLFGEPVVARKRRSARSNYKVDVFEVESDLSVGERTLIASYMTGIACQCDSADFKRAAGLKREADRYAVCGEQSLALQCERDYMRYFVRLFCHSRICERCARIYVRGLQKSVLPVIREVDSNRRRGYVLAQLTLTVTTKRFGDDLPDREGIRRLYRESSEFLRRFYGKYAMRKTRSGKWREDRKRYIGAGWLATIEIGKDNNNLHSHVLVYGPIRSQALLKEAWAKITGDSFGVDIRRQSPLQALNHVLHYIAKPPATDSYQRVAEYADMIKGSRRLRSGGIFYNRFKKQQLESSPLACPVCGHRLRVGERLDSIPDDCFDLRAIQRGEINIDFDVLSERSACLPGGVTPISLPF